jgi:hypothetical protein
MAGWHLGMNLALYRLSIGQRAAFTTAGRRTKRTALQQHGASPFRGAILPQLKHRAKPLAAIASPA